MTIVSHKFKPLLENREHLTNEGFQIAWDATSLSLFKTCPRKYFLEALCGWKSKRESRHLTFGHAFHKGFELYERAKFSGLSHEDALKHVVRELCVLSSTWASDEEGEESPKNRKSLLRAVVWKLEEYRNDPLSTYIMPNGSPAVEYSFRFTLPHYTYDNIPYVFCGHFDRVATMNGEYFIIDHKTTSGQITPYFFEQFNPNTQMTLYNLAGKFVLPEPIKAILVDAVQIGKSFARFGRGFVRISDSQTAEFIDELKVWIAAANDCVRNQFWPKNESSCGNYGGCRFRSVCSRDCSVQHLYITQDFEQNPWNPLTER